MPTNFYLLTGADVSPSWLTSLVFFPIGQINGRDHFALNGPPGQLCWDGQNWIIYDSALAKTLFLGPTGATPSGSYTPVNGATGNPILQAVSADLILDGTGCMPNLSGQFYNTGATFEDKPVYASLPDRTIEIKSLDGGWGIYCGPPPFRKLSGPVNGTYEPYMGGEGNPVVSLVAPPSYTITPSAGAHGNMTPSSPTPVTAGNNQRFSCQADSGYAIAALLVDGVSVPAAIGQTSFDYDFSGVQTAHTIAVTFRLLPTVSLNIEEINNRQLSVIPTAQEGDAAITDITIHWGDGQGTTTACVSGQAKTHLYPPAGGTWGVYATVTDAAGMQGASALAQAVIDPNDAPAANFTVVVDPTDNRTVRVTVNVGGDPDGIIAAWRFAPSSEDFWIDGTLGETLIYTYPEHGAYDCRVEVTDNEGASAIQSAAIDAGNDAPFAAARISANGLAVTLIDISSDSDGEIAFVIIDWGDGATPENISSGAEIAHDYAGEGRYDITLTAIDDDGAWTAREYTLRLAREATGLAGCWGLLSPGITIWERESI